MALALSLEAVVRARAPGAFPGTLLGPASPPASPAARAAARAWLAYCALARPWVRRGGALAAGAFSFLIVWSEATIGSGTSPDLSPFSHVRPPADRHPVRCGGARLAGLLRAGAATGAARRRTGGRRVRVSDRLFWGHDRFGQSVGPVALLAHAPSN